MESVETYKDFLNTSFLLVNPSHFQTDLLKKKKKRIIHHSLEFFTILLTRDILHPIYSGNSLFMSFNGAPCMVKKWVYKTVYVPVYDGQSIFV